MSQYGYSTTPTSTNYNCGTCTQTTPNGPWSCTGCNFTSASNLPKPGDSVVFASTATDISIPDINRNDKLIFNGRVVTVDSTNQRISFIWLYTQKASPISSTTGPRAFQSSAWVVPESVIQYQYPNIASNQANQPIFTASATEWYNKVGFNSNGPNFNTTVSPFTPQPPQYLTFNEWNSYLQNRVLVHYPQA